MKRTFLQELGLDKEVIDKIIDENGNDIENARKSEEKKFSTERETLQGQINDLQSQVKQRDTDLADLNTKLAAAQENADKLTEAQTALTSFQSKYDAEREEWERKNAQQAYEFAVREKAGALEFSSVAAKREFIREAIGKNFPVENGVILGFDDYVKTYRESDPGAFVPEKAPEPEPTPAPEPGKQPEIVLPGNSGTQPGGGKSLAELMRAKNANPEMLVNFNK